MITVIPTVGSMLTVIGVTLLAAAVFTVVISKVLLRPAVPAGTHPKARRSRTTWRRGRFLARPADAPVPPPAPAGVRPLAGDAPRQPVSLDQGIVEGVRPG